MKKFLILFGVILFTLPCFFACSETAEDELFVYNWGEYISDGSEDSLDVIAAFEEYYEELTGRKIKVHYTTYPSNEDMYAKISSGTSKYDVVIPSDYMIERMISEDLLLPVNIEEVCEQYGAECYYGYIGEDFRGLYYDPTDTYSVPYTYGRVGVIYNTTMVDEADCTGWELLWNEKYTGKILQFNNSRDGFATALYSLGHSVNTTDPDAWHEALDLLLEQKPLIQSYVMDEIYNKMESGEAAVAAYYAGDYFTMYDINEDLGFFYPENTNIFVDSMCIPKGSGNPEIAALFINFMLSPEPAIANAEYIYYASPNSLVFEDDGYIEDMGEEVMQILYPEDFDFAAELDRNGYRNLDTETLTLVSSLWEELKITGGLPADVYVVAAATAVAIAGMIIANGIIKRRRAKWY